VIFLPFDHLSDLTAEGILNEALQFVVFVGLVLLYLRYIKKARVLGFLKIRVPHKYLLGPPAYGNAFYPLVCAPGSRTWRLENRGCAHTDIVCRPVYGHARRGDLLQRLPVERVSASYRVLVATPFSSLLLFLAHLPSWFALGKDNKTVRTYVGPVVWSGKK
jgi:hypothetical protein